MDYPNEETLNFITKDEKTKSLFHKIPKIASTNISVLITGESGTGKEIVANFIHRMSERRKKPFVAINCAAIPPELLESELFGYRKGAFTGASNNHQGLFEVADGGTILLDEIGDMPLSLQAKLLRIIQDKSIRPVGSSCAKQIDFRIVSATHRSLKQEIRSGKFREDLYYRLCGFSIHLPALRERREDIKELISYFVSRSVKKYSLKPFVIAEKALEKLLNYSWPGNVRQLENLIEQMAILYQGNVVNVADLLLEEESHGDEILIEDCFRRCKELPTLAELTEKYVRFVYDKVNHHQGHAAKILGVSRRTIYRKALDNHSPGDLFMS